jgi:hypothetical protein
MPISRAFAARPIGLFLAIALVGTWTGACGSPAPSASVGPTSSPTVSATPAPSTPAPSGDANAAIYAEIQAQVTEMRGLAPKRPVTPTLLSREELGDLLRTSIEEDAPPELLAAYERLYRGMGLMAQEESLATVYGDLLESQVGGLYVPADESLYVVSEEGALGPIERVLFAHEFTHALQDQHFDLGAMQEGLVDQTDRQLARQALIEGDAYVLNTRWMLDHLSAAELTEIIAQASDPELLAALDDIPPIVQSAVLFAATQGTQWILGIQARGGWEAVNAIWARPPESTEQILHPDTYETNEPPIEVAVPDDLAARLGAGWSVILEDTFGEHQLGVWLSGEDAPNGIAATLPAEAALAASGWGGDRVAVLAGPDEATAIVLMTEWDTAADAGEFADRADAVREELGLRGIIVRQPGARSVRVLLGSNDAVVLSLDLELGVTGV